MWPRWIWVCVLLVELLVFSTRCYLYTNHNPQIIGKQRKSGKSSLTRARSSTEYKTTEIEIDPFNTSLASFEVQCKLGSGAFAVVYKAKKKDGADKGCFYALKTMEIDEKDREEKGYGWKVLYLYLRIEFCMPRDWMKALLPFGDRKFEQLLRIASNAEQPRNEEGSCERKDNG